MDATSCMDREQQLEQVRLDPLITAGWQAMVLLAMAIIIFTAGLGYVTYLLGVFPIAAANEMGFLQSVGLSSRQMAGLLMLEHFIIVAVGIGLGSGAGWLMSDLMVSSVAVTENGRQVVPALHSGNRFPLPRATLSGADKHICACRISADPQHAQFGLSRYIKNGVVERSKNKK